MQSMLAALMGLLAVLGASGAAAGESAAQAVTPVQKVIQMLTGMLERGKQEKHTEQLQFAAYKQFCDDTTKEKQTAVTTADSQLEMLKADIQMADTGAGDIGRKVDELDADITTWSGDLKAATQVRELERTEYMKVHKEYSDTMDAIDKAVQLLQAQARNRAQAPAQSPAPAPALALLDGVGRSTKPVEAMRVIAAFLARDDQEPAVDTASTPDAYAYEFRSSGVIDMLEKLKDKFTDERTQLEKEEMNKRHAFELLNQDLKKSVANAEATRSAKVQQKAKELQRSADMKGQLQDITSTRADDQKYLTDMTATCTQKSVDYNDRQKMRADEIVAIQKAVEILSGAQVLGSSNKYFPAMLQRRAAAMLVQLRSSDRSPNQLQVAAYLHDQAEKIHSRVLSALALRVRDDPFSKVKKMIKDLIMRLMEEAGEEAQHKGWCDTELSSNEQVRNLRSNDVERLTSEIDQKKSNAAKLADEITGLTQQLAETDQASQTSTQIRQAEKTENEQTIKDAQDAQIAVGQAVTVLKEFYAMAATATLFVQRGARKQTPPIFEAGPYKGMEGDSGGVIAMLEVIQSDYARLESTTRAMEATAQQDYDRQTGESAVLKAQIQKDIEHKTHQKQTEEQALVDRNNDLASARKELDAANNYYEKLKPSCLDAGMSFQERDQRRQEEIQSLQEALRILNGEDLATT